MVLPASWVEMFGSLYRARANGSFSSLEAPDLCCVPYIEPESEGYFVCSPGGISVLLKIAVALIKYVTIRL